MPILPPPMKPIRNDNQQSHPNPALSESDKALIAQCLDMPRKDLQGLLQRVCDAGWGYASLTGKDLLLAALKDDDANYDDLMLCALVLAKNAGEWREFNALATFWAERKKGKPAGASTNINIGHSSGEKKIQIVFMNADDVKREREGKLIDVTPRV